MEWFRFIMIIRQEQQCLFALPFTEMVLYKKEKQGIYKNKKNNNQIKRKVTLPKKIFIVD